ncbi:MAG: histidyl-tRNA synthetase [Patescibacteria group bacterium]|nr:histidyl-tRNA synthetase [Patescibacteria group bacterium]
MSKKAQLSTEPYKGVRDFYPEDQALLNYLFATYRRVAQSFGYVEYHASVLEPAELYKAKGSENEEIVNEQTYTFLDRGEREVTLRPEMTPTVARMVSAKRRELGFPLRLFSIPNLFRYERPQRGRLREHWQLNVDLFGSKSVDADVEIVLVAYELMRAFGAQDNDFVIKLGSRSHLDQLVREHGLSAVAGRELINLLDRKGKIPKEEFDSKLATLGVPEGALSSDNEPEDIAKVIKALEELGVSNAVFDPSIVRGFDYYTGLVFEIFDTHPDNNRALFGGGRYDNLTALFDDEPIVGIGFGMGDVTIRDFLAVRNLLPPYIPPTRVYLAVTSPELVQFAMGVAKELREANIPAGIDFGEKKLGDQIKTATKHAIPFLIVIGENEQSSNSFTIKDLKTGEEKSVTREELSNFFNS